MMNTIGILANPARAEAQLCAEQAAYFLRRRGVDTMILSPDACAASGPDCILTFGGDGTLLIGARFAVRYDIPLLGINLGNMGFLTEEEPKHLEQALSQLLEGKYHIEDRSILQIANEKTRENWTALNDAVITRGGFARLIRVEISVNGQEYGLFTADGVIVATPTGSTGYSLSAGGPIVQPDMNCMILTPVCAHSLVQRPCIISGNSEVNVKLQEDRQQSAELQIDGQNMGGLRDGDKIRMTVSNKKFQLIRLRTYDFFGLVRSKLNEWGSTHP